MRTSRRVLGASPAKISGHSGHEFAVIFQPVQIEVIHLHAARVRKKQAEGRAGHGFLHAQRLPD